MLDVNFFDELRIGLASAGNIREWSFGEVKKPEQKRANHAGFRHES